METAKRYQVRVETRKGKYYIYSSDDKFKAIEAADDFIMKNEDLVEDAFTVIRIIDMFTGNDIPEWE